MFGVTLPGLARQEYKAAVRLREALETARVSYTIGTRDRQICSPSSAGLLNAGNPYARALWGNALWNEFVAHFSIDDDHPLPDTPLYWVSLADLGCMSALTDTYVDVSAFARHLRCGLRGLSYLGMMEPGLYANIQPGTEFSDRSGVSWHFHLFVWGESPTQMKARFAKLNDFEVNYRPIIPRPEGIGAKYCRISAENLIRRFRYMIKSPRKAYRVGRIDEITSDGLFTVRFKHNKADLRPGQCVTLFNVLKHLALDALTAAGGEGVAVRKAALKWVLADWTRRTITPAPVWRAKSPCLQSKIARLGLKTALVK